MTEKQKPDQGPYTVVAKVISQEGRCVVGHQVGDEVVFDGRTVDGRMCMQALYCCLPMVFAMRNGAERAELINASCSSTWSAL